MSDQPSAADHGKAWPSPRPAGRPSYRRLFSELVSEHLVAAPSGDRYLIRVRRNSPIVGSDDYGSDPTGAAFALIKATVQAGGRTGWRIEVFTPPRHWRAERLLFTQQVGAEPILADVVQAVKSALERGDKLWPDAGD